MVVTLFYITTCLYISHDKCLRSPYILKIIYINKTTINIRTPLCLAKGGIGLTYFIENDRYLEQVAIDVDIERAFMQVND